MKRPPALHISSREIETFVLDTQVPGQPAAGPGTFVGAGYVLDGLDSGNPFQGKIGKRFQANGVARWDCSGLAVLPISCPLGRGPIPEKSIGATGFEPAT